MNWFSSIVSMNTRFLLWAWKPLCYTAAAPDSWDLHAMGNWYPQSNAETWQLGFRKSNWRRMRKQRLMTTDKRKREKCGERGQGLWFDPLPVIAPVTVQSFNYALKPETFLTNQGSLLSSIDVSVHRQRGRGPFLRCIPAAVHNCCRKNQKKKIKYIKKKIIFLGFARCPRLTTPPSSQQSPPPTAAVAGGVRGNPRARVSSRSRRRNRAFGLPHCQVQIWVKKNKIIWVVYSSF